SLSSPPARINCPILSTFRANENWVSMKKTKDNFSKQSELYQKFRPGYPQGLIDLLCEHIPETNLAWDCATGNGQVARMLSEKFERVVATDISAEQLEKAATAENITYRIERAEKSSLPDASADLVMVAQAIHWFDFDHFYTEAQRVLKKDGLIAVIGYPLLTTENGQLDETIRFFYRDVVGKYWDAERKYIDERYASIPFPFEEIHLSEFEIKYNWSLEQISGYLKSWSAVGHFKRENGTNPLKLIEGQMNKIFSETGQVEVKFEIIGRYGRMPAEYEGPR
ncbi:MAG: class I SAM-dependent methyltransferase, partial [Pricia sp.]